MRQARGSPKIGTYPVRACLLDPLASGTKVDEARPKTLPSGLDEVAAYPTGLPRPPVDP